MSAPPPPPSVRRFRLVLLIRETLRAALAKARDVRSQLPPLLAPPSPPRIAPDDN